MNSKNLFALSVMFAATAITPFVTRADDASSPTPTPTTQTGDTPPAHGRPGGRRGGGGPYNLKDLTAKLSLTDDQQKTVGDLINTARSQGKEVRDDDSLAQDEKRAKMKEIFTTLRSQIRAALTPDQQKIFDSLPVRMGPPPGQQPGAAPAPTPPPTN